MDTTNLHPKQFQLLLEQMEDWICEKLPDINTDIEMGRCHPNNLLEPFNIWVQQIRKSLGEDYNRLTQSEARKIIQLLLSNFIVKNLCVSFMHPIMIIDSG